MGRKKTSKNESENVTEQNREYEVQIWESPEFGLIRTSCKAPDKEPFFVATDVARVLGYRDAYDMGRSLDDDEKDTQIVRTLGGKQKVIVISESGLYHAIFMSRREEAKTFRRWVTEKVLPQIRRTGSFGTMNEQTAKTLKDFEQRFDLLETMVLKAVDAAKEASKNPDIPNVTDARERVVKLVKQAAKVVSLTERETWYELYRGYAKFTGIPLLQTARAMNMTVIDYLELIDRMESLEKFAEQVFWFV